MAQSWLADVLWMMGPKHLAEAVYAYRAAYAMGSSSLHDLDVRGDADGGAAGGGALSPASAGAAVEGDADDVFDTRAAIDYYTDTCAAAHGGPCSSLFDSSSVLETRSSPRWAERMGYGASWRLWHLHRLSLGLRRLGDFAASAGHVRTVLRMLGSVSRVTGTESASGPPPVTLPGPAPATSSVGPVAVDAVHLEGPQLVASRRIVVVGGAAERVLDSEDAWNDVTQRVAADVTRDTLGACVAVRCGRRTECAW